MANYKNLLAWQKAHALALEIYKATENFPRHELFGLTSQLRRAALSIPTNLVEGYNRKSKKEFARFIDISLGSLAEVEYLVEFSTEIRFLDANRANELKKQIEETGRLLWGLQRSKLQRDDDA